MTPSHPQKSPVSQKEIAILSKLLKNPHMTQREIAFTTGYSLGLINGILKKHARNGLVEISPLNKKKVKYQLTQNGKIITISDTYRRSMETIKNFKNIQAILSNLFKNLNESGCDYFSIHGEGEIYDLVETTFNLSLSKEQAILGKIHRTGPGSVILNISPELDTEIEGAHVVNILEQLIF